MNVIESFFVGLKRLWLGGGRWFVEILKDELY